jgi:hypothetical protein
VSLSGREETAIPDPVAPPFTRGARWLGLTLRLALRGALNPRLALDLLRLVWAFRARGWYRRAPFLPLPPADYMRWRMYTAYGDEQAVPPVEDVIRFATWRRRVMRL